MLSETLAPIVNKRQAMTKALQYSGEFVNVGKGVGYGERLRAVRLDWRDGRGGWMVPEQADDDGRGESAEQ